MDGGCPPIVTVPKNLSFDDVGMSVEKEQTHSASTKSYSDGSTESNPSGCDLSSGYPVYLTEDWESGIGGGLWTTGLALGRYFASSPHFLGEYRSLRARKQEKFNRESTPKGRVPKKTPQSSVRVLELGSGNGFLGVCLVTAVAVAEANEQAARASWPGIEVVVTDTAEHLPLMRATIESNLNRILPQIRDQQEASSTENESTRDCKSERESQSEIDVGKIARAEEYLWGEDYDFGGNTKGEEEYKNKPFDLIIGSDVAYRDHLHDPLIAALDEFCVPEHTVALIGVTMNDTKPIFFEKLYQRGFSYEKLADHLLGDEFCTSARQFGVFCISKR